ncbi:MAG: DUF3169 family protein [Lachnospiraceae bacterium]|nr:DUF3169 family protein [Lachnospiraceae bacterium]
MSEKKQEVVEKKKVTRKKDDKKYFVKFMILLVISATAGYGIGFLFGKLKKSGFHFPSITQDMMEIIALSMPIVFLLINIVFAIISILSISKVRKQLRAWDGEDEELADKIDMMLGLPIGLSGIMSIINMFMFSFCIHLDMITETGKTSEKVLMFAIMGVFILSFVVMMLIQKKCIDLTKDMNPEKQGSIFDVKFTEKWEESCDEAQKLQIYQASYGAFRAVNSICITLWLVCLILDLFFGIGITPVIMVTIIWLGNNVGYLVTGSKLEKAKLSR